MPALWPGAPRWSRAVDAAATTVVDHLAALAPRTFAPSLYRMLARIPPHLLLPSSHSSRSGSERGSHMQWRGAGAAAPDAGGRDADGPGARATPPVGGHGSSGKRLPRWRYFLVVPAACYCSCYPRPPPTIHYYGIISCSGAAEEDDGKKKAAELVMRLIRHLLILMIAAAASWQRRRFPSFEGRYIVIWFCLCHQQARWRHT